MSYGRPNLCTYINPRVPSYRGTRSTMEVRLRTGVTLLSCIFVSVLSGCASLTNPVANGVPVRLLPEEIVSCQKREQMETVSLALLGQEMPEHYRLAKDDVLGIFVGGVLPVTDPNQPPANPPVYFPSQIDPLGVGLSPSLGFPIPVTSDGTITLPLIGKIDVDGKTIEEADQAIRKAYIEDGILEAGRERIIVTLMQPRRTRVKVFRQEVGGFSTGGRGGIVTTAVKRGTGHTLDLRAYENDVASALVESGGLPGLDTFSGIYIFRNGHNNRELVRQIEGLQPGEDPMAVVGDGVPVVHIPTRWPAGAPLPFSQEDVILHPGDMILIEARPADLFYTGGLLPSGEHILPRDYDLDVLEAIARVQGPMLNGAFAGNNLAGVLVAPGTGTPSPSLLTIIRQTQDGRQIPIKVDLNRAMRDRRERILVQPGDLLLLQLTPGEAIVNYFQNVFNFTIFGNVFQRSDATGVATLALPNI